MIHRRDHSMIFQTYGASAESAEAFSFFAMQKIDDVHSLFSLRLYGEDFISCKQWRAPIARLTDREKISCYRAVDIGKGIWVKGLASEILTDRERQVWKDFGRHEGRRRQWLLGRLAVKHAVCSLVVEQEVVPREVEISTDEKGRPFVTGELSERPACEFAVSIAHSKKEIVGIACRCDDFKSVGIDIEPVDRQCEQLERLVLNGREQRLVLQAFPQNRNEGILRFWCAKEAVVKALGLGMAGGPLNLVIEEVDSESGKTGVSVKGKMAQQAPDFQDRLVSAFSGCAEGLVYATAVVTWDSPLANT